MHLFLDPALQPPPSVTPVNLSQLCPQHDHYSPAPQPGREGPPAAIFLPGPHAAELILMGMGSICSVPWPWALGTALPALLGI